MRLCCQSTQWRRGGVLPPGGQTALQQHPKRLTDPLFLLSQFTTQKGEHLGYAHYCITHLKFIIYLVRQSRDPHALTRNGVRHHRGRGVTHRDPWQRLRHRDGHRRNRDRYRCHRNRWRHPLCDSLCQCSRQGRDLGVEVGRRCRRRGSIGRRSRGGSRGSYQILLCHRPRLQPSAAQGGVSLCYAVVVGADSTHRGRQALLGGRRGGGERHDFGLASELGVLLQENLVCGNEVGNLRNNSR